jgi:uncharacterized membrane protein
MQPLVKKEIFQGYKMLFLFYSFVGGGFWWHWGLNLGFCAC